MVFQNVLEVSTSRCLPEGARGVGAEPRKAGLRRSRDHGMARRIAVLPLAGASLYCGLQQLEQVFWVAVQELSLS